MRLSLVVLGSAVLSAFCTVALHAQRIITTPQGLTSGPTLSCTFASLRNGATFSFAIEGAAREIGADRDEWFQPERDQSSAFLRNSGVRLYPRGPDADTTKPMRAVTVDLGKPVAPNSRSLGVQSVDRIVVHWKQDDDAMMLFGPLDIPVGRSVSSERTEVFATIGGKRHVVRFGDMDVSVCWPGDAPLSGAGTTEPILIRTSENEWILDLPSGSRGRLSEMFGNPTVYQGGGFIDRGLYAVSARIRMRLERLEEQ